MIEEEVTFYKNLGESIKNFRKKESLSQETLAKHLGLSRISIVNIEKGKQKVQIYTLFKISDYLKVSIDKLMPEKSVDIISNKVTDKVNKAGGDFSSIEKVKGFIETINNIKQT
ncbi:helix-turn-helix transcriptional regulator [Mucilaginibacter gilvus]|uniref:helix-turn-helix transcriptional regulator n=1 Tax=Mucilaginibacter gilvus TaxID=2305909 RepID=UPI0014193173|nr:helix-turn-helix transcriptional regulator [Mucilaginibacter gilvus]